MIPNEPPPRLLVVDDDEGLLILMAEALRGAGYEVATAGSGRAALEWLEQNVAALMLLDLKMRGVDGPALMERLEQVKARVPFIVVTGQGDEKIAVEVMKRGARDYVMKNSALLDLLPGVVRRTLLVVDHERALVAARLEHERLEREILAASERERQSIGADLHDGLGQQLTAIEFMCAGLKADVAAYPDVAQRLGAIAGMLRESVALTRFLARGLVPVADSADGLQTGLAELASRTNALGGVSCHFESPEPVVVADRAVAGQIFRLAQEAVNNALKHAKARRITIRLETVEGRLKLEISDDGAGLPKANGAAEKGLGLGIMRHRAGAIGAELTIRSKRGEGVVVTCLLPEKS